MSWDRIWAQFDNALELNENLRSTDKRFCKYFDFMQNKGIAVDLHKYYNSCKKEAQLTVLTYLSAKTGCPPKWQNIPDENSSLSFEELNENERDTTNGLLHLKKENVKLLAASCLVLDFNVRENEVRYCKTHKVHEDMYNLLKIMINEQKEEILFTEVNQGVYYDLKQRYGFDLTPNIFQIVKSCNMFEEKLSQLSKNLRIKTLMEIYSNGNFFHMDSVRSIVMDVYEGARKEVLKVLVESGAVQESSNDNIDQYIDDRIIVIWIKEYDIPEDWIQIADWAIKDIEKCSSSEEANKKYSYIKEAKHFQQNSKKKLNQRINWPKLNTLRFGSSRVSVGISKNPIVKNSSGVKLTTTEPIQQQNDLLHRFGLYFVIIFHLVLLYFNLIFCKCIPISCKTVPNQIEECDQ